MQRIAAAIVWLAAAVSFHGQVVGNAVLLGIVGALFLIAGFIFLLVPEKTRT